MIEQTNMRSMAGGSLSIVVPLYNEEENVLPLVEEIAAVAARLPPLELILVDDGSTDRTPQRMAEAASRFPFVRTVSYQPNRGQSAALLEGLRSSRGDLIAMLDGDLQNDPADLPRLVSEIADVDCVLGYRAQRRDVWSRRLASQVANRVRNAITRDGARDTGCTLKIFRRELIGDLPPLDGVHRFMPAWFALHGRRMRQVPVRHRARRYGRSKYSNLRRLPRTLLDLFGFWWYRRRYLGTRPPLPGAAGPAAPVAGSESPHPDRLIR
ncbi:MAG TPA: glycosyltransferase [Kiritimatiellae bacterium]|nr:glycosyltransferase [Kiritimatiellia bacterium]